MSRRRGDAPGSVCCSRHEEVTALTHTPDPDQPEVSVIVICYNDGGNLSRAVRSVLRQSLRNVEVVISDDGSTDSTPAVARQLADSDPRVRYLRSDRNSGGCGVPRNSGLAVARAPFVMFLDSDDELERHACYNLVMMARRENCDVVAGKCRRYYVATDVWTTWYRELFEQRRVVTDVESEPDLLFDSISTNKLYRKSFLDAHDLWFPERVKYEDLQFTAQMYARVSRLGVIPETVYHWRIYPEEVRKTITHQRSTPQNVEDRFNAIEVAADTFRSLGKPALAEGLLVKLLRHDARITIEDAADTPDDRMGRALFRRMEPHLRAVPSRLYRKVPTMDRVALGMALLHDREGVREAKRWSRNKGAVAGRLVQRADRVLWTALTSDRLPEPGTLEAELCDVTEDPILQTPTPVLRMAHVVDAVEELDQGIRLLGVTHDPLMKFTGDQSRPELELRIRMRSSPHVQSVPVQIAEIAPGMIRWTCDVRRLEDRNNAKQTRWWVSMRTTGRGRLNDSFLCLDARLAKVSFAEPAGLTRLLRARIRLYTTRQGDFAFKRARLPGRASAPGDVLHKAHRGRVLLNQAFRKRQGTVRHLVYRAARRLPVKDDLILFDAHMGKQYADNPKAIYEELVQRDTDLDVVWDFRDPTAHGTDSMHRIKRHTLTYARILARARFIVDNQGLPEWARKREGQYHLQTWHGTPLKRMALHKLEHVYPTDETITRITGEADWDALISPSDYFEQTFVDSYRYKGHLIRGGTPRNDVLINNPQPDPAFVRSLDLPPGKKVVLYAPTFRERVRDTRQAASVLLDLDRWIEEMGETHYLLLRPHYLNRFNLTRAHAPYLMEVSKIDDIGDLFRVADLLVTDYSSVMFDYAWLDRPIIIYAPDYDSYAYDTRGTYFELKEDAPGPFCETQAELHDLIKHVNDDTAAKLRQLRSFRDRYCGHEDGKASLRVVDHLLAVHRGLA